jgi:hypothetical protein
MAAELRQFIQKEHAVVRQRHVARQQCRLTPLIVKNVLRLTMHGHEIASLLPGDLDDGVYKTAADQPHIRHRVMEGATRAGRNQGHAVAGEAGDAVDACGLNGPARVIAGRIVVSCRASIDLPASGGPSKRTLRAERLPSASRSHLSPGSSETMRALVRSHTFDAPTSYLIGSPHQPGRGGSGES